MRLLSTKESAPGNYEIQEFTDPEVPQYAILSHTWQRDEVSFQDMEGDGARAKNKGGFEKIKNSCSVALRKGFEYIWIDTCCIDKTSSAELSEAINSMYQWYGQAEVCFAYLADVPSTRFEDSKWFTRGWTLQELIAPKDIKFFDATWRELKSKEELQHVLSNCTSIPVSLLSGDNDLKDFCVAQKMSWAAKRKTTRIEDRAYSLMGLFGVNMPLIYGEKENSFIRLQEEILRITDDHTLFAWRHEDDWAGLLATSPEAFASSRRIIPFTPFGYHSDPVTLSSRGIHLALNFIGIGGEGLGLAIIHCKYQDREDRLIAIYLQDVSFTMEHFRRVDCSIFATVDLTKFRPYPYPVRKICVEISRMRHKGKQPLEKWDSIAEGYIYTHYKLSYLTNCNDPTALLLQVAESGDKDAVWLLLTRGDIGIESTGTLGQTSLSLATKNEHESIVKILLKSGANIEAKDIHRRTPLFFAAENGNKAIFKLLLDRNAKIEARDVIGHTPLTWATDNGCEAIVKLLLDRDADIEAGVKGNGNSRPRLRGPTSLLLAAANGNDVIVKLLLDSGANIEARDKDRSTPLLLATAKGNDVIVKLLLDSGANIEARDKDRSTPLLLATAKGNDVIVNCYWIAALILRQGIRIFQRRCY